MDPATLESLIIREVRKGVALSRRDLAERLGVARSTAGRRVDFLIEHGILRETGSTESEGAGRPKRLLELDGRHGCFVGFDFDARQLFAVLVDFAQSTIREERIAIPQPATKRKVLSLLRKTLTKFGKESRALLGTGIGTPGRVHQESRTALGYPYIDGWEKVDLAAELEFDSSLLHIENNTRTIALGEYWLAPGGPTEHLVCLSVRTGISAAIVSEGKLLRGIHETAGEIRGWNVRAAAQGENEWLETAATVRAVPDWPGFVLACKEGDVAALARLDRFATLHADALARLVQLADPELVVVSGAFAELGELYLDRLRRRAENALTGHYFPVPPLRFSHRGEFTGAHGAAALAAQQFRPASGRNDEAPRNPSTKE